MNKLSRIQSFFLEMAFVILFFSLAVAVVIRFFAAGNQLSQHSQNTNGAVLAAESWFEQLSTSQMDQVEIYYDSQWNPTMEPADFRLEVSVEPEQRKKGLLCYYHIVVLQEEDSQELFQLDTAKYWPGEGIVS